DECRRTGLPWQWLLAPRLVRSGRRRRDAALQVRALERPTIPRWARRSGRHGGPAPADLIGLEQDLRERIASQRRLRGAHRCTRLSLLRVPLRDGIALRSGGRG